MRFFYFTVVMGIVLVMAGMAVAQTSFTATVQQGPVLMQGASASADVFVNGRLAIRVTAPAFGMSAMERANDIRDRLNAAFSAGASWNDTRVSQVNNEWTVTLNDNVIATATTTDARVMRMSTGALATKWARQTVVALGGQPSMIASQLIPAPSAVAGSTQQLGAQPSMMWSTAPTKIVPLLNGSTGNVRGSVTIGGPQSRLDMVNSVVFYQSTTPEGTLVTTFVPITSGTVQPTMTRVRMVGLVSIPAGMVDMSNIVTGDKTMSMVSSNGNRWNSSINTYLSGANLGVGSPTKVVPLYSTDMNKIVGGVQVVGNASDLATAQAVLVNTSGDMLMFNATTAACAVPLSGPPPTLKGVLISSIITLPISASPVAPGTSDGGAEMTPPPVPEEAPAPAPSP